MQLKFIYTNPDGTVGIVGSAHLEDLQRQFGPEFSLDDLRAMIAKRSIPSGATYVEMPMGWEPPVDREFRNAWRGKQTAQSVAHADEPRLHVDMPHARELLRDKLRRKRIAKLAALDVEYMAADESGDQQRKRAVAARKQALRDAPSNPAIEAAQTPGELKAVMLEVLSG
jgi:hypothetical protein